MHAPQLPPDLRVSTTWPTACLPIVERTSMTSSTIDIHLRGSTAACVHAETPLRLLVNPARAAGSATLALGVYQVRIFLRQANDAEEMIAFGLLDASGDGGSVIPENGFWWSVASAQRAQVLPGSGITIERQGENLAITLLGYEAGHPVWYFGSATMRGAVARVNLVRMLGGSEPFGLLSGAPTAQPGPVINLEFLGPAQAKAWLEQPSPASAQALELQELDLLHLAFASGQTGSAWRGQWILVHADSTTARVLTLSSARSSDAETFRLADDVAQTTLDCRVIDLGGHAMPSACSLSEDAGIIAEFDRIGLDRMSGRSLDGTRVQLVRLPN